MLSIASSCMVIGDGGITEVCVRERFLRELRCILQWVPGTRRD